MTPGPLSIALGCLIHDGKIALIRRERGDYQGLWAIPGGKVEQGEHIAQAAQREILEETGIRTRFSRLAAVVSEHLYDDGGISNHFILYLCVLVPEHQTLESGDEGACDWFSLKESGHHAKIIPSDREMIGLLNKDGVHYAECTMRWDSSNQYRMESFTVR